MLFGVLFAHKFKYLANVSFLRQIFIDVLMQSPAPVEQSKLQRQSGNRNHSVHNLAIGIINCHVNVGREHQNKERECAPYAQLAYGLA